jgi:hypothetical protein
VPAGRPRPSAEVRVHLVYRPDLATCRLEPAELPHDHRMTLARGGTRARAAGRG